MTFDQFLLTAYAVFYGSYLLYCLVGSIEGWLDSMAVLNNAQADQVKVYTEIKAQDLPRHED